MSEQRVDWHRVFDDFAYLGMTGDALAQRIGLSVELLQPVATGAQWVSPVVGARLTALWISLTGKPSQFLPRTVDAEGATRPEVPGIDSNAEQEQCYAQLQAIVVVWAQISARR